MRMSGGPFSICLKPAAWEAGFHSLAPYKKNFYESQTSVNLKVLVKARKSLKKMLPALVIVSFDILKEKKKTYEFLIEMTGIGEDRRKAVGFVRRDLE
jgi:hypothetical protein